MAGVHATRDPESVLRRETLQHALGWLSDFRGERVKTQP
jgi:hypothetical protein